MDRPGTADVAVIGAGVIGLAIASKLASTGLKVKLIESAPRFGTGVSSRSSQVIHAGIHYEKDSLKARLCREGRDLLYAHCERYRVSHSRTGKILVAASIDDLPRLSVLLKRAKDNGVDDLIELDRAGLKAIESELEGVGGVLSPSTGILSARELMESLFLLARERGTDFLPGAPVEAAEPFAGGWRLYVAGREPRKLECGAIVNASGLGATALSQRVFPQRKVPALHATKGSYLRYDGPSPFKRMICPAFMPGKIEDRMDATPAVDGTLRFGPSSEEARDLADFSVHPGLKERFIPAIRRYFPRLDPARLHPDTSGHRPRIYGANETPADFRFDWAPEGAWLDCWGLESPALTACLAIADHVGSLLVSR